MSKSSPSPSSVGNHKGLWALGALLLLLASGCGAHEGDHPSYGDAGSAGGAGGSSNPEDSGTQSAPSGCSEGHVRECRITIKQASGVTSCWDGLQLCQNGVWSRCMDPDDVELADPSLMEGTR